MIRCIHQLMPPKVKIPKWMYDNGCGDCNNCMPDIANQHCRDYTPVQLVSRIIRRDDE